MGNYMYIIECGDGSLYTGWTNDLAKRMKAHNMGQGAKYTKSRRPVRLCYWEAFNAKREAMSREAQVKRLTRARKLGLIRNENASAESFDKTMTGRAMRIRPVSVRDDRMAISRVYEESWKEAYRDMIPRDYLDSIPEGAWCEAAFRPDMYSLVVTAGDEIVGTASYCERRPFDFFSEEPKLSKIKNMKVCGEIVSIYFLPQYIGKGFGTLLMQAVFVELKKLGYQSCSLWVLEKNERARHFYEKMGFVPDGTYMVQEILGERLREVGYFLELQ